jgi:hypothetical protein
MIQPVAARVNTSHLFALLFDPKRTKRHVEEERTCCHHCMACSKKEFHLINTIFLSD